MTEKKLMTQKELVGRWKINIVEQLEYLIVHNGKLGIKLLSLYYKQVYINLWCFCDF